MKWWIERPGRTGSGNQVLVVRGANESNWETVAEVFADGWDRKTKVYNWSSAHLIAAAPELLEALELAIKVGVAGLCTSEQIDLIEQSIARAKGGAE